MTQDIDILNDPDFPLWFVGGCVRDWQQDILDGKEPRKKHHDIDCLATHATSTQEIENWLTAHGGRIFDLNRFNIVRGFLPGVGPVDISPPRADIGITDGRRPESVILATPEEDLDRRDFTINAMAMTMNGELIDLHGGLQDLRDRTLRFVGDPAERLREDAFRAVRALRFMVTKQFVMDDWEAIEELNVSDFDATSTEIITAELEKCMRVDGWWTMRLLHEEFDVVRAVIQSRGDALWFRPTMEHK